MTKIAIFVDVQNIYYTTRDTFSKQFNYRQFWQKISKQGDIVIANAYAIERSNDDQQHKFQKVLGHIGFDVKLKPFIQRCDGSAKGDWDVGITIDILESAPMVDKVILLSGDGDFDLLMKKVRDKYAVNTQVYGVKQLTALALMNAVDEFIEIDHQLLL
ncbi:NYN domain-containing protein [Thalassotalea piscium]|uniref:Uncharacterized LabA/DUF88 family protein n=1 Tax=Thalassotalea piscium TaxID=1230533 RepID=A0A7X0TT62_9GAMM|nr:NYN domain-containing protein [Thalassotalea piscium]MBB6542819.1 uncharacterized LabA/DUF88 family protein [Thalassotalea piscium]